MYTTCLTAASCHKNVCIPGTARWRRQNIAILLLFAYIIAFSGIGTGRNMSFADAASSERIPLANMSEGAANWVLYVASGGTGTLEFDTTAPDGRTALTYTVSADVKSKLRLPLHDADARCGIGTPPA